MTEKSLSSAENHTRAWLGASGYHSAPAPQMPWRWHGPELSDPAQADSPAPTHSFTPDRFFWICKWGDLKTIWRHHPVFQLDTGWMACYGEGGSIPFCSALGRHVWVLGPVWGTKGSAKQSEPGDTLAVVGGGQGTCGELGLLSWRQGGEDATASTHAQRGPGDTRAGLCLEGHSESPRGTSTSCSMGNTSWPQGNSPSPCNRWEDPHPRGCPDSSDTDPSDLLQLWHWPCWEWGQAGHPHLRVTPACDGTSDLMVGN